jgi:hypothetical protein
MIGLLLPCKNSGKLQLSSSKKEAFCDNFFSDSFSTRYFILNSLGNYFRMFPPASSEKPGSIQIVYFDSTVGKTRQHWNFL